MSDITSFDLGEAFLSHYGVKGMHWGIRNERQSDAIGTQPQLTKEQKTKQNLLKAGKAFAGVVLLGYAGYQIHDAISGYRDSKAADRRLVDFNNRRTERWGDTARSLAEADRRAAARLLYADELKAIRDILDDTK